MTSFRTESASATTTTATPYATWRELLRQVLGVAWDLEDGVVLERLRVTLERDDPEQLPWLSLLADALGIEAPASAAVEQLAPEFQAARRCDCARRPAGQRGFGPARWPSRSGPGAGWWARPSRSPSCGRE